jgi:hypothetical protein
LAVREYPLTKFPSVTEASGTAAPEGSVTTPLSEPLLDCAWTLQGMAENTNTNKNERMLRAYVRMKSLLRLPEF